MKGMNSGVKRMEVVISTIMMYHNVMSQLKMCF